MQGVVIQTLTTGRPEETEFAQRLDAINYMMADENLPASTRVAVRPLPLLYAYSAATLLPHLLPQPACLLILGRLLGVANFQIVGVADLCVESIAPAGNHFDRGGEAAADGGGELTLILQTGHVFFWRSHWSMQSAW